MKKSFYFLVLVLILAFSCQKENVPFSSSITGVSKKSENSVNVWILVDKLQPDYSDEIGICYTNDTNDTVIDINDNFVTNGKPIYGNTSILIENLDLSKEYFFRLYYIHNSEIIYEDKVISFIDKPASSYDSLVYDFEGNKYKTVKIGYQIWMAENLKATKYNDGSSIKEIKGGDEWSHRLYPAYCYYNNDYENYGKIYGPLYNYRTINSVNSNNRNVCPSGWHVPTKTDFQELLDYLGDSAFYKIKESGNEHWTTNTEDQKNESGFTALPGGYRWGDAGPSFGYVQSGASFWTSTEYEKDNDYAYNLSLLNTGELNRFGYKSGGCSIRCIKD